MIRHNYLVFGLVILCTAVLSSSSVFGSTPPFVSQWFNSGDQFSLQGSQYTVLVSSDLSRVSITGGGSGVIVPSASCRTFLNYRICVDDIAHNMTNRAYLVIGENRGLLVVGRSNASFSGYPGDVHTFRINFTNNGTAATLFNFTESFPSNIDVSASSPCVLSNNAVTLQSQNLGSGSHIGCQIRLTFRGSGSSVVSGVAREGDSDTYAPPLSLTVRDAINVSFVLNDTEINVTGGERSTWLSINISNNVDEAVPVSVRFWFDPAVTVSNAVPFAYSNGSYLYSSTIFEDDVLDFMVRVSHNRSLTTLLRGLVSYTYGDVRRDIVVPSQSLSFIGLNSTFCTAQSGSLNGSSPIGVRINSTNSTTLQAFQPTQIELSINNTVSDATITDIHVSVYEDGVLIDRSVINLLLPCQRVNLPAVDVSGGLFSSQKTKTFQVNGSGYVGTTSFTFSETIVISLPKTSDIVLTSHLPSVVYRGSRFNRSVDISTSVAGAVPVHIIDRVQHGLQIIGIPEQRTTINGSRSNILSYHVFVPANYPYDSIIINTTAEISSSEGTILKSSVYNATVASRPFNISVNATLADATGTLRVGSVTPIRFTLKNMENKSVDNLELFFVPVEGIDVSEQSLYIGTLHPHSQIEHTVLIRNLANASLWNASYALFSADGLVLSRWMSPLNFSLASSSRSYGLGYSSSAIFDDNDRLFWVNLTIHNADDVAHQINLPYVDAVWISYENDSVLLDPGKNITISYATVRYDRDAWQGISYSYLGTAFYSAPILPDLAQPEVPLMTLRLDPVTVVSDDPLQPPVGQEVSDQIVIVVADQEGFSMIAIVLLSVVAGLVFGLIAFFVLRKKNA